MLTNKTIYYFLRRMNYIGQGKKYILINNKLYLTSKLFLPQLSKYIRRKRKGEGMLGYNKGVTSIFLIFCSLFAEYDKLYNEMEKKRDLHKIGQVACTSHANIQPQLDFYSNQPEVDSGMEMNVNMHHSDFQNMAHSNFKSLNFLLEQGSLSQNHSKKLKRNKTSKQSSKDQQQPIDRSRNFEKPPMRKLIKMREMVKLFHDKATMNSPFRQPVSYNPFQNIFSSQNIWFLQKLKINFNTKFMDFIYLAKAIFIVLYFFIMPLSLLYQNLSETMLLYGLKWAGIIFSFFDFAETVQKNYTVDNNALNQQKYLQLRRDKKIQMTLQFFILISTVFSLVLSYCQVYSCNILFLGPCFNISHFVQQLHRLQDQYLNASQLLKYWSLFKVIIKNLFVCHLLACTLIVITFINKQNNWMTPNSIDQLDWYQQYIWSYYFGTTIILTIGFGDLHANNTFQAFFIIVISFFACVFFGYNINYIGNLINNIKQEQNQRNSKLKLLSSLSKKSKISKAINDEIARYIIEESKIKQKSNYTQQKKLLKELPQSLRSSFLQEANEKIFNHLRHLIPLGNQAIQKLSLKIEARLCHPDQMIKGFMSQPGLIILQSGQIGYITRSKYPSKLRNIIIQRISSKLQSQSKLICLDLMNQPLNYDIKSLDYSVIYEMDKATFEQTIIQSKKDYQVYRQLLDKCRYKLNQFALIKCRFCENRMHTLFECPRVHYQPFRKTLPLKYNKSKKVNFRQTRVKFERNKMQVSCQVIVQSKNSRDLQSDLSDSRSITNLIEKSNGGRAKRTSSNKLRMRNSCLRPSNENMMMTIQMVTQLRDDIKNLKRTSFTNFQFTLWDNVDCDEACNFHSYFSKFNPDVLGQKQIKNTLMSKTNRIKRKPKLPYNI